MNNNAVENILNDCMNEFTQIEVLVNQVGSMSPMSKYFTLYSLIKASGVIEYAYKTIVADFHNGASNQVRNYIDKMIRNSSKNPSLDNMNKILKDFDPAWHTSFKHQLDAHPDKSRLVQSLSSLNDNRNNFAHGLPCSASFSNIKDYFNDAVEIIKMFDAAVA